MDNLISIIIPVYNVEEYFQRCIDTVINQTYKNIEIILVDDGSTDNSGKLCDEYAAVDNRIKVIHQVNKGVGLARRAGMEGASGKYVGFVDPDDYVDERMFEILYKDISESGSDIAVCTSYRVELSGEKNLYFAKLKDKQIFEGENVFIMYLQDYFSSQLTNKLFNIKLFENIAFSNKRIGEDAEIVFHLFYNTKKIIYNPKALYYYIKRDNSITESNKKHNTEILYDIYYIYVDRFNFLKQNVPHLLKYYITGFSKALFSMYETLLFDANYDDLKNKILEELRLNKDLIDKYCKLKFSKKIKLWSLINCLFLFKVIVVYEKNIGSIEKGIRKKLK